MHEDMERRTPTNGSIDQQTLWAVRMAKESKEISSVTTWAISRW